MTDYYLHDGQNQSGPFNPQQLKSKELSSDTHVWKEGMPGWQRAGDVEDLKELLAATPPPFNPAPPSLPPVFEGGHVSAYERYAQEPKRRRRPLLVPLGGIAVVLLLILLYWNGSRTALVQAQLSSQQERASREEEQKKLFRVNWKKHLKMERNENYTVRFLGGISNLKIIFSNDSDYVMDEMTASVTYIKANGGEWRTIPVKVTNVPPHTKITQPVDDVPRGVNVRVQANEAISREANFSMINGYDSGDPEDPFRMR